MRPVGTTIWAIAHGCIRSHSTSQDRTFVSHETASILNAGPYCVRVPAGRTLHLRFNGLQDPEPIPRATDYSSLFESDVPVVNQNNRLDSRRAELALLTTAAYSQGKSIGREKWNPRLGLDPMLLPREAHRLSGPEGPRQRKPGLLFAGAARWVRTMR